MHRFALGFCVVAIGLIAMSASPALEPRQEKKSKDDEQSLIMKKKLVQAQKLLETLALQDFDKMKTAADELAFLRMQAGWMIRKTVDYEIHSNDFQRQIDAIRRAAIAKNVDAAALAYVEMTLTCVKCHKHVREQGVGQAPLGIDWGRAWVRGE